MFLYTVIRAELTGVYKNTGYVSRYFLSIAKESLFNSAAPYIAGSLF